MNSSNHQSHENSLQLQLQDALDIRDALEDILKAMDDSPGELEVILDVILEKALRLCHAQLGGVFLYSDGLFEAVDMRGLPET